MNTSKNLSLQNSQIEIDLQKEFLPNLQFDYLSLTCRNLSHFELVENLVKIKPHLKIVLLDSYDTPFFINLLKKSSPTIQIVAKNSEEKYDYFDDSLLQKREKADLVFYNYYKHEKTKEILIHYVRIPGSFADQVLKTHFFQTKLFNSSDYSISRIDVKINPSGFEFTEYSQQEKLFQEFHQLQKLENYVSDSETQFSIGYIGHRTQRRMVRIYIAAKEQKKTFEVELKKQSAKNYSQVIMQRNLFQFNKILILELLEVFKDFQQSQFSLPLIKWKFQVLVSLKNLFFSQDSFYKRRTKLALTNQLTPKKSLQKLLKNNTHFINYNVVQVFPQLQFQSSLHILCVSFFSKLLVDKWFQVYGNYDKLEELMHQSTWDPDFIKNELFTNIELYKIQFSLPDLLEFFQIQNRIENRTLLLNTLNFFAQQRLLFVVNQKLFNQPLIYSLVSDLKKPYNVSLILHPLAVYDLLNSYIIFNKTYIQQFQLLIEKHQFLDKKQRKLSSSVSYTFLSIFLAYSTQNVEFIRDYIAKRNKDKPLLRLKQYHFFCDVLRTITKICQIQLFVKNEKGYQCFLNSHILQQIYNQTTDSTLKNIKLEFQNIQNNPPLLIKFKPQ